MRVRAPASLVAVVALLVATACAPAQTSRSGPGVSSLGGSTSGYALGGRDLQEYGGTLLSYLDGRIVGMEVDYSSYPCPSVQIRGRKTLVGSTDPVVYVNGARTANVCVLEDLLTRDIRNVEIYPMGVAHQPGYESHANGLILVFLLDGPLRDLDRENESVVYRR